MTCAPNSLRTDLAAAHALILAQCEALAVADAKAAAAESVAKSRALEIEKLNYQIAKLKHEQYGQSSERGVVLAQLELQLCELEEDASEAEAAAHLVAERAKAKVNGFERRKPARRPLPAHLPRERIVYSSPSTCPCCGGRLQQLGEDVTETLELVPRRWTVIEHMREKFSCRSCEQTTQPPAPSHPIARGRAGPQLLARILFGKYGLHLPLNRQSPTNVRAILCDCTDRPYGADQAASSKGLAWWRGSNLPARSFNLRLVQPNACSKAPAIDLSDRHKPARETLSAWASTDSPRKLECQTRPSAPPAKPPLPCQARGYPGQYSFAATP